MIDIGPADIRINFIIAYALTCIVCSIAGYTIIKQMTPDMGRASERSRFTLFVGFFIVFCISNIVNAIANNRNLPVLGMAFSIINTIAILSCAYEWFRYILTRIEDDIKPNRFMDILFMLPLVIAVGLIITTPFTHLLFYYENGEYQRGPLYIALLVLSAIYLIYASTMLALVITVTNSKKKKGEYLLLLTFAVFPVIGGLVDLLAPHLPVMEMMSLLGIVTVFTNMQQSNIFVDSLTGLNNRRKASAHLADELEFMDDDGRIYLFLADIDDFKKINDRYGHSEGDRALILIANALREFGGHARCQISRWGGDEFVIIGKAGDIGDPNRIMAEISEKMSSIVKDNGLPYKLEVSVGYASAKKGEATEQGLLAKADEMMYRTKRSKKETSPE